MEFLKHLVEAIDIWGIIEIILCLPIISVLFFMLMDLIFWRKTFNIKDCFTAARMLLGVPILIVLLIIFFTIWLFIISPLYISILNGNIVRAFIVIVLLSMHFSMILSIILSYLSKYEDIQEDTIKECKKKRKNGIFLRLGFFIMAIYFYHVAIYSCEILYEKQHLGLYETDQLYYSLDGLHVIISLITAVIFVMFWGAFLRRKPFLKISQFICKLHKH